MSSDFEARPEGSVSHRYGNERNYWLERLSGDLVKSSFPYSTKWAGGCEHSPATAVFKLEGEIFAHLMKLSKGSDYKLHMIFIAIVTVLLQKYTGNNDIIIGTPIYKQDIEAEFVNTVLAARNRLEEQTTFKQLLLQVRQTVVDADEHQNYPIEMLLQDLQIPFSRDEFFPLFDVAVILDNIQERSYMKHIDVNMMFSFNRGDDCIDGVVEYNAQLYTAEAVERLAGHLQNLAGIVLADVDLELAEADMLSEREKKQLLDDFNPFCDHVVYPRDRTIHELFEQQVEKTPDHKAVTFEGEHLTYRRLNQRANRLARVLRERGLRPGGMVALLMERSLEMIVSILAILKAGGGYLPIHPDTPKSRIIALLDDSNTPFLLTRYDLIMKNTYTALQGLQLAKLQPYISPSRPQLTDLDSLPMADRSLIDYEKYGKYIGLTLVKKNISLQATRGCPYNCAYCHKLWPKKHYARSAENIFEEVKCYYDMGVRRFSFVDDIFNLDKKNSSRFFQLLIKNKLAVQIFFPAGVRGDIMTKEYIDLMIEGGTVHMALALETGSPRLQKLIGKNLDIDKFRENIQYLSDKYPHVISDLFTMHGFPTETEEDAMMTLDFIKSIRWIHFPFVFVLKIYQNTEMERLALANGISREAIIMSEDLAYQELPHTLPFGKSFSTGYQADFLSDYFLSRERLLHVLPFQMKRLTEDEIAQKYNSYLPTTIASLDDLLQFIGITREELGGGDCLGEESIDIPGFNRELKTRFSAPQPDPDALRVLLLDLSQLFGSESGTIYNVVEPPLGVMNLMTYIKREFGGKINGNVAKSRIDFDDFAGLKRLLEEFKPDVIGIRTLTFFKNFFHRTTTMIRQWGIDVPIISGGPYATSSSTTILQDRNVDLIVLGEGEITFAGLIGKFLEYGGKMPPEDVLKDIQGVAFIPGERRRSSAYAREVLVLDEIGDILADKPDGNLEPVNQPSDLAYTIYTSGTTGQPKGVMVEHGNVTRLFFNDKFQFDFGPGDTWTMFHAYNFDFSVWEIFGALLYGGRLVVVPEAMTKDMRRFLELLKEERVTVLNQVPSVFYNLAAEELSSNGSPLRLKYVIFGGEALHPAQLKQWKTRYPQTALINMFGITETTVHVTYKEISDSEIDANISNIGKPIPTLSVYVMDPRQRLAPLGVVGELVVGGDGVGRGYLNRPQLTHQRFIDNPYKPGERLYRSGDLARLTGNGDLEYIGRLDHQVKVRGFRIELGEIESQLMKHDRVEKAVVMARKVDGDDDAQAEHQYLCAYIEAGGPLTPNDLREYLLNKLPEYMIPVHVVVLEQMPLTPSGKIDRKALPDPMADQSGGSVEYAAQRSEVEKKLAEIWEQVLGREHIGIHDNYFMMGGDSINSIQIASRLNKAGYKIEMRHLFHYPTIAELAPFVKRTERIADQGIVSGVVPLTPVQYRFFARNIDKPHHYNQAAMLHARGTFDADTVRAVFSRLLLHHDALRMTFKRSGDGEISAFKQGGEQQLALEVFDFRSTLNEPRETVESETVEDRANELQASLDLEKGPLMKLALFHLDEGDHLLIVIHHLVVDGVSWRILFEDIDQLFKQYRSHRDPARLELPLKSDSFKTWSEKLHRYANRTSEDFIREKMYWRELGESQVPEFVRDYPDGDNYVEHIDTLSFQLSESDTQSFLTTVNEAFNTEINDLLLTALAGAFGETFGIRRLLVALEGHGREEILEDVNVTRTVGWFISVYPVLLNISSGQDLSRRIVDVKETLRRVPNNGIGYGILKYLTVPGLKEGINLNIEPRVRFNYSGQFDGDAEKETFEITEQMAGRCRDANEPREYELEVEGRVIDRRMTMAITFGAKQYKRETIEILTQRFQAGLEQIVSHCLGVDKQEVTPSDLGYKDISVDQLKNFFD